MSLIEGIVRALPNNAKSSEVRGAVSSTWEFQALDNHDRKETLGDVNEIFNRSDLNGNGLLSQEERAVLLTGIKNGAAIDPLRRHATRPGQLTERQLREQLQAWVVHARGGHLHDLLAQMGPDAFHAAYAAASRSPNRKQHAATLAELLVAVGRFAAAPRDLLYPPVEADAWLAARPRLAALTTPLIRETEGAARAEARRARALLLMAEHLADGPTKASIEAAAEAGVIARELGDADLVRLVAGQALRLSGEARVVRLSVDSIPTASYGGVVGEAGRFAEQLIAEVAKLPPSAYMHYASELSREGLVLEFSVRDNEKTTQYYVQDARGRGVVRRDSDPLDEKLPERRSRSIENVESWLRAEVLRQVYEVVRWVEDKEGKETLSYLRLSTKLPRGSYVDPRAAEPVKTF